MAGKFHHEAIYRGASRIDKLATVSLTLCGAGALGSLLADNLARQGLRLGKVIDRDRVEEHNVGTQLYGEAEVGTWKVEALRNRLFRSVGIEIEAVAKELTERNARSLLKQSQIVLDTFDNSSARRLVQDHCRSAGVPCLHLGLFADYGEVIWDEAYRVPGDADDDVCDYPLARNLILLTVAVAAETLLEYLSRGERHNRSITLRDFAVRTLEQ